MSRRLKTLHCWLSHAIAQIVIDPGRQAYKDHWKLSGANLLTAAILHVLYAEPDKTLRGVGAFLSNPSRTKRAALERMLETNPLPAARPHPVVAQIAAQTLSKSDNEISAMFATVSLALRPYAFPKAVH